MAEKKFGWGTVLLASGAAALVAGGVVAYLKREELKKFAEDIMSRVSPDDEDEYEDEDCFADEPDGEEEIERDIVLTEDEDDEPEDVEIEITIAEEDDGESGGKDAKAAPADAAEEG